MILFHLLLKRRKSMTIESKTFRLCQADYSATGLR